MQEKYFTTGTFAKICHVEKHVLLHYEKIGLFRPAIQMENGYRYYSIHQYDTFIVIRTLKNLGMSLNDIKIYLEKRNPELFLKLMDEKYEDAQQEIRRLESMKEMIRRLKEETNQAPLSPRKTSDSFAAFMEAYICFSGGDPSNIPEFVGNMITVENIRSGNYLSYSYFFTPVKKKKGKNGERKKGTYLCAYHRGMYQDIGKTYQTMLDYASRHRLELGTYAYEDYMIADIAQKPEPAQALYSGV